MVFPSLIAQALPLPRMCAPPFGPSKFLLILQGLVQISSSDSTDSNRSHLLSNHARCVLENQQSNVKTICEVPLA